MRFVEGCLNLEFIELNLSLDYEIVINRVVNFGLRKNWEIRICANVAALITELLKVAALNIKS